MFPVLAILAMAITGTLLLLVLFEPNLHYHVTAPTHPLDSDEYLCLLGALCDAQIRRDTRAEVFSTGQAFYDAEIQAISNAHHSINLEAYIFRPDATGQRFITALTDRARARVKVNLVLDAIGSLSTPDSFFSPLRAAGGRVHWYQPIRFSTLKHFNNRTHRELLVIDGTTGFIGGAGIADAWSTGDKGDPPWRDTVLRLDGDLVTALQTTFSDNWLESADEILTGTPYFPHCTTSSTDDPADDNDPAEVQGLVVSSAPSAGRSTRARILFQTLLASAKRTIHINSPYFLPDHSVRRELIRAVQRGVTVRVITPGDHADHLLTRRASRRLYGTLLKAGIEIHEYQPAMIHAKVLTIDDTWAVLGSTNFDNRSFGLNDEVNLAARNPTLLKRLNQDFHTDLSQSHRVTLEEWQRRPLTEKLTELASTILQRNE